MVAEKQWDDLRRLIGENTVRLDTSDIAPFRLLGKDEDSGPEGVIRITETDQIVKAIQWARRTKTPLTPVSSGPPHFQSCLDGTRRPVVLDLSGMDDIITVNRRNRVALVQAGVRFEALVQAVTAEGLRAALPLGPRPGKSCLAAYLDREPTIYPRYQWDLSDPLLCLEMVWGTGDVFRTGSAAGPGTLEEQWRAGGYQNGPMGPGQNDWMKIVQGSQGAMAVAAWCSMKCEIRPKVENLFLAGADSVHSLINASYAMHYGKLPDIHFLVDRNALTSIIADDRADRKAVAGALPPWNMVYTVSGIEHFPAERAAYLAGRANTAIENSGARILDVPLIGAVGLLEKLNEPSGNSMDMSWRDRPEGAHGRIFFQTTMDRVPLFLNRFESLCREAGLDPGLTGVYIQPQLGGRCCHLEFILAADPSNTDTLREIRSFCDRVAGPLIEAGAFFSRPHGVWARAAMSRNAGASKIYRKVKAIFDPDAILASGRMTGEGADHVEA